jgi:transposase
MAYSIDYRKRVIEYRQEGHALAEIRKAFKIYPSTLRAWEGRQKDGDLAPKYPETRAPRKLPPDELKRYVEANPDAFLVEIGAHFGCSAEAVRKALKKLNITRKKRRSTTKNARKKTAPNIKKI